MVAAAATMVNAQAVNQGRLAQPVIDQTEAIKDATEVAKRSEDPELLRQKLSDFSRGQSAEIREDSPDDGRPRTAAGTTKLNATVYAEAIGKQLAQEVELVEADQTSYEKLAQTSFLGDDPVLDTRTGTGAYTILHQALDAITQLKLPQEDTLKTQAQRIIDTVETTAKQSLQQEARLNPVKEFASTYQSSVVPAPKFMARHHTHIAAKRSQ